MLIVFSALAFLLTAFYLAWRFEEPLLRVFPIMFCAAGLLLYVLAFFNCLHCIDYALLAAGIAAAVLSWHRSRRLGAGALKKELRRQFSDARLYLALGLLLAMLFCLRGAQILEWDAFNFWGPDTKSLFYRDGFAPRWANAAPAFGDYMPMFQLLWWWGLHLAGHYSEQVLFFAYYTVGALFLFSLTEAFRLPRGPRAIPAAALACVCALALPGVACTSWYRSLYVDPFMAIVFGTALAEIVRRDDRHPAYRRVSLLLLLLFLALIKTIAILWSAFALLFYFLWNRREKGALRFTLLGAAGVGLLCGSWKLYCAAVGRSSLLVTDFPAALSARLAELSAGTFLSAGNNPGYLRAYARAFLLTPIHREWTFAVDLTPALLLVLLFCAAAALRRFGFLPRGRYRSLVVFMIVCIVSIYAVLILGQLTMFYDETQYLDPVKAVTLMTRYCAPADMGLLLLLTALAGGGAAERELPARRQTGAALLAACLLLCCGAWQEMGRRFVYDPLNASRIEKRETFCAEYSGLVRASAAVPLDEEGGRILVAVCRSEMNPIVINEVAPVSMLTVSFTDDAAADAEVVKAALAVGHEKYFYVQDCPDTAAALLSACTADGQPFRVRKLYRIRQDGAALYLTSVS